VILRAGHRVRQVVKTELLQAGQEKGKLLPAKGFEDDPGGALRTGA